MYIHCRISITVSVLSYVASFQALGVFGLCQIHAFIDYVRSKLSREQFDILFRTMVLFFGVGFLATFGVATAAGSILFF